MCNDNLLQKGRPLIMRLKQSSQSSLASMRLIITIESYNRFQSHTREVTDVRSHSADYSDGLRSYFCSYCEKQEETNLARLRPQSSDRSGGNSSRGRRACNKSDSESNRSGERGKSTDAMGQIQIGHGCTDGGLSNRGPKGECKWPDGTQFTHRQSARYHSAE